MPKHYPSPEIENLNGNRAICSVPHCHLPLIFNGAKWVWVYDIKDSIRTRLITNYNIDQRSKP